MKTLANCNPKEFLVQTNKIRKSVSNWLELTKVLEIRKHKPEIPADATAEEKRALREAQVKQNLSDMLDAILDEHPDESAELLGLMCFIEPDDLENHKMTELLIAAYELISCPEVISFFTLLTQQGQTGTSGSAKA